MMRAIAPARPAPLSRSISTDSVLSAPDDDTRASSKRTRKRFSQEQLTILERMFERCSHPSTAERAICAKQMGMDVKSVNIWFQNKRQMGRKVALQNSTNRVEHYFNHARFLPSTALPPRPASAPAFPLPSYSSSALMQRRSSLQPRSEGLLSLDRIASRAEMVQHPSPSTPPSKLTQYALARYHTRDEGLPLWDAMPSSPLQPGSPSSPFSRDILDFASKRKHKTGKRTLEWACASARLAEKASSSRERSVNKGYAFRNAPSPPSTQTESVIDEQSTDMDSMDDSDPHEAITPDCSQGCVDVEIEWDTLEEHGKAIKLKLDDVHMEEDIMDAALALCGLSASMTRL